MALLINIPSCYKQLWHCSNRRRLYRWQWLSGYGTGQQWGHSFLLRSTTWEQSGQIIVFLGPQLKQDNALSLSCPETVTSGREMARMRYRQTLQWVHWYIGLTPSNATRVACCRASFTTNLCSVPESDLISNTICQENRVVQGIRHSLLQEPQCHYCIRQFANKSFEKTHIPEEIHRPSTDEGADTRELM